MVPAVKEPAPQPKHKDEKSAAATSRQESVPYVIQLGAFANLANAKERQSKLAALKVKFYTETVKTPSGDKLRVRAGPYATRQEAERVQAKLKAAGIQDGVVAEKKG
jgi:DedD protein